MRKLTVFFMACALAWSGLALAAEQDIALKEVVVSANKIETSASEATAAVSVATAEDMEITQDVTLEDVVSRMPGVFSSTPGGMGQINKIRIRGASNKYTQIRYDDFPLRDVAGTQQDFSAFQSALMLPPGAVDRVEVLKGSQSALYGSSAMGGVVSLFTPQSWGSGTHFSVDGNWGSFNTARLNGQLTYGNDKFYINLTPIMMDTDGYKDIWFHEQSVNLGSGVRLTDNSSLELTLLYIDGALSAYYSPEWVSGDEVLPQRADPNGRYDNQYMLSGLTYKLAPSRAWDVRLKTSYSHSDRTNNYGWGSMNFYEGKDYYAELLNSFKAASFLTLLAGGDYEGMQIETSDTFGTPDVDKFFNSGSVFGKALFSFWDGALDFNLGGRYGMYDRYDGRFTYDLGAAYNFFFGLRLYANMGTGYRTPSPYETYGQDWRGSIGNPDLAPERSVSYEAGLEQRLWDDKIILSGALFKSAFKDLINYTGSGYENIDKARSKGFEVSAVFYPHEILKLDLAYTYAKYEEKDGSDWSVPLNAPTKVFAATACLMPLDGLSLGLTGRWQSKSNVQVFSNTWPYGSTVLEEAGFFTMDLAAEYTIKDTITLYGKVKNLLDRDYTLEYNAMPGINAYAGVRIGF